MKSRILAFAVVALLVLMVWGLTSLSRSISGVPASDESDDLLEEGVDSEAAVGPSGFFPFANLNDVSAMEVNDKTVQFVGRNGTRVLDLATGTWSFSRRKYVGSDIYSANYQHDQDTLKSSLPEWYKDYAVIPTVNDHVFDHLWARCRMGDEEYVLVSNTWEVPSEDVIAVNRRVVYRMPYRDNRFMVVHNGSAWLGGRYGVTRLDLATGSRWEYICPPRFENIAGWVEDGKVRYVTSREGDFMMLDTQTHRAELVNMPNGLLEKVAFYPGGGDDSESNTIAFSNPVLLGGKVYFAANSPHFAAILSYHTFRQSWGHIKLPRDMPGPLELIHTGEVFWCAGGGAYGDEEGSTAEVGGVASFAPGGKLKVYPTLLRVPIAGYRIFADTIRFQSAKALDAVPRPYTDRSNQPEQLREIDFYCTMSLKTLEIVGYTPQTAEEAKGLFDEIGREWVIPQPASIDWRFHPAVIEVAREPAVIVQVGGQ